MTADDAEAPLGIEVFEPAGVGLPPEDCTPEGLSRAATAEALSLGFNRVSIVDATPLEAGRTRLRAFLERGYAGSLSYLEEGERHDPSTLLPGVKSLVVVLFAHGDAGEVSPAPDHAPRVADAAIPEAGLGPDLRGQIARYARGTDYHILMKTRLFKLGRRLATLAGRTVRVRACVDTAPLLERELAARAGLGFQGKSSLLIAPGLGSYVLLGELLIDLELAPSPPPESPRKLDFSACGSCRACLDACPTQAFPSEYVLDARRCISYLTIEQDGVIPEELRRPIGTRVFGCDVCQEVCPFNASKSRPSSSELGVREALLAPDLVRLLNLGSAPYRTLVKRTALRRASRATLQRNAAVALGNSGDPRAVAPLVRALVENERALVRLHAAWALGELAPHLDEAAVSALIQCADADPDAAVRAEARSALTRANAVTDLAPS